MRIVESACYSDADLSVYVKIKALGQRPEGCTAGIATIASYLHLSPSTVERAVARLRSVVPDGIVELPENQRRSLPGGRGTTALRRVRPMNATERFIWLPVHASEVLSPRLLRAYAVIAYSVVQRIPLSVSDLAHLLRHHSGARAGQPITVKAAGEIVARLAAAGWITVDRRAGVRGRHLFLVHNSASPPLEEPPTAPPTTPVGDGSGPDVHAGSLAYEEDPMTDRPDDERELVQPAVGDLTVEKEAGHALDRTRPLVRQGGVALRAGRRTSSPPTSVRGSGTGTVPRSPDSRPPLTFSPRVDAVLEPVRMLLGSANRYVLRRIGREIGRRLDEGASVERLRARVTQRLASTFLDEIRDPGRWLLGVALPRWGCANPDCETGVLWSTGEHCRACTEFRAARRITSPATGAVLRQPTSPPPLRSCCPTCERLLRPGQSGECAQCSTPHTATASAECCPGRGGVRCGRPTAGGMCWRCRTGSPPEHEPLPATVSARAPLWAGTG
ncbi:hypothetical protein [Streptomyces sp. NPDC002104]